MSIEITPSTELAKLKSSFTINGNDYSVILIYSNFAKRWFLDLEDANENKILQNLLLTTTINFLQPYLTTLQFGLVALANDEKDPFKKTDFSDGRIRLWAITKEEVLHINELQKSEKTKLLTNKP